jgi:hypothetical protein
VDNTDFYFECESKEEAALWLSALRSNAASLTGTVMSRDMMALSLRVTV